VSLIYSTKREGKGANKEKGARLKFLRQKHLIQLKVSKERGKRKRKVKTRFFCV